MSIQEMNSMKEKIRYLEIEVNEEKKRNKILEDQVDRLSKLQDDGDDDDYDHNEHPSSVLKLKVRHHLTNIVS